MLAASYATIAFRSAIGMIGERIRVTPVLRLLRDVPEQEVLARRLQRAFAHVPGAQFRDWYTLAGRAIRGFEQAHQMNQNPALAPVSRNLPIDPTIRPGEERYRYYVLTRITDASGHVSTFTSDVRSDTPMSQAQIQQEVSAHVESYDSAKRTGANAIATAQGEYRVDVTILSAGRRA